VRGLLDWFAFLSENFLLDLDGFLFQQLRRFIDISVDEKCSGRFLGAKFIGADAIAFT
jgi:hypothetical protein